jgi:hypothetical protein
MVVRTLRRRTEWKTEDVLGKDKLGLANGKATRGAIGILRISVWRNCVLASYWQNAFDRVNWTKLIQILMGNISTGDKKRLIR